MTWRELNFLFDSHVIRSRDNVSSSPFTPASCKKPKLLEETVKTKRTCPICQAPITPDGFCVIPMCRGHIGCVMCGSPLTGPGGTCSYKTCPTNEVTMVNQTSSAAPRPSPDGRYSLTFCDACGNPFQPQDRECALCRRPRNGKAIPRQDSLPPLSRTDEALSSAASTPDGNDPVQGSNWPDEPPTTPMPRTKSGVRQKSDPGAAADLDDCAETRQKK
jgi:hypothetical protein